MAQVLAVASGKGGVGKTTTALNVAALLAEGGRVVMVDADPQASGSASWWWNDGDNGLPFDVIEDTDPDHLQALRTITDYDVVVVDTAPSLDSSTLAAVAASADVVIIPTQPIDAELVAAVETVNAIDRGNTRVLVTQVDSRALSEALAAQAVLADNDIACFRSFVRRYKHHQRARSAHTTAGEIGGPKSAEAAADYRSVVTELLETTTIGKATQ